MSDILQDIGRRIRQTPGERIRRRRQELGLNQAELAQAADITQGYVSAVERGRRRPRPKTVQALADALAIPAAVLVSQGPAHDNPQPLETKELPLFGSIPAGPPSESQEPLEMWPVLRHLWAADHYCLRLSFDSMEPTLKPGDIVLVHYRPDVNPLHVQGKICACLIDGQPTLKRISVEGKRGRQTIILRGDNPDVVPLAIQGDQSFSIQGLVVKLVSREL